jgi:hypothetical protein
MKHQCLASIYPPVQPTSFRNRTSLLVFPHSTCYAMRKQGAHDYEARNAMPQNPDDSLPAAEEELSDERLPLTELESISARPPSWRKRGAQLALLALALCVGLVATWSAIVPGKRQAAQPKLTSISTLLVSNLTNATITLNGKKLAGHPPMTVSAYLESDEITISAPDFHPYTCHFKGMVSEEDATHCLFATNGGLAQVAAPLIIGVYLTPDDLIPGQKDRIEAPLIQQLSSSQQTATQPGDAIATAFAAFDHTITSQPATTPLQASVSLVQIEPQSYISHAYSPFSPYCKQFFCPFGFGPGSSSAGQVWGMVLNVALRWRFTKGTGAPVADVTYPSDSLAGSFLSLPEVQFAYDATGWHLAADNDVNATMPFFLCNNGTAILEHRLSGPYDNLGAGTNKGVEGCLISVQAKGGSGLFLWRFGVLLAANDDAHAILPDLPIASPAAIAAVSG